MNSNGAGSVTLWMGLLKAGDQEAARVIWTRYYNEVIITARSQLRAIPTTGLGRDEEDVALSVFDKAFRAIARGQFDRFQDRHDLWQILSVLIRRTVIDQIRRARSQKRGGNLTLDEASLCSDGDGEGLDRFPANIADPAFAVAAADRFECLLDELGDDLLRRIALLTMDGHTANEIADVVGCSRRNVFNKLKLIRMKWERGEALDDRRDAE